jgi:ABC-2 type transport system ATP-binding protein
MAVPAISLSKLTKRYGASRGVSDIDLRVEKGEVFGFLGPNGAGKTTTIRMLMDFIRPSSGEAKVLGLDCQQQPTQIHKRVGFLAGDMEMDPRLTGRQYLEYVSNLRGGVPWSKTQVLIDRLQCETDRKIGKLSRGNKQKVALVSALMDNPEVLILDEPTSGLDPIMQSEFNAIIREHRAKGKTAFISSHDLSEVEQICDRIGFIREGQLIAVQPLKELTKQAFKRVSVTLIGKPSKAEFQKIKDVTSVSITNQTIHLKLQGDVNPLLKVLSQHKIKDLSIQDANLDDIFMSFYESEEAANV